MIRPGHGHVVDLFCGCGGFSLGAHAAGLGPSAAFDIDPVLTSSFSANHVNNKLYLGDLSRLSTADILSMVNGRIDGIIGGPPCQGFSEIGLRKKHDPRRLMLDHFFRIVADVKPIFFVMENVKGLGFSDSKHLLTSALDRLPSLYTIIGPIIVDAAEYGAATRRPRMFVIGYNRQYFDDLTIEDIRLAKRPPSTVRDAIDDLSSSVELGKRDGFDVWRLEKRGTVGEYAKNLRSSDCIFTGHRKTAHSKSVECRFAAVPTGQIDPVGRHPRLKWDGQCPTLRAGTGSDKGSFQSVRPIHPDLNRVITVREAARLQGFPDSFRFHPTVWHSFRMIGNSVSPILSKAIMSLIASRYDCRKPLSVAAE